MKELVKSFCITILIALVSFSLAQENKASAQINEMLDSFLETDASTAPDRVPATAPKVTPEQVEAIDERALRYVYDPSVTEEVRSMWVMTMVQNGAEQTAAEEHAKVFSPELNQAWVDEIFSGTGFRADNIADIMAIEVILNMVIAQQLNGTPIEGDIAVRNIYKVNAANTSTFKSLTDREKQFFAESSLLKIILGLGDYQNALQNESGLESVIARAQQNLRRFGIDYRMFTIKEEGLVFTQLMDDVIADKLTMEEAFPDLEFSNDEPSSEIKVPDITVLETETDSNQTDSNQTTVQTTVDNPLNTTEEQTPTNPLAQKKDPSPFAGSFSGDGLILTLTESATGFSGELNFDGQVFPVEATGSVPTLTGSFGDGSNSFPFSVTLIGSNLNFDSQGNVFNLQKENANPLGN